MKTRRVALLDLLNRLRWVELVGPLAEAYGLLLIREAAKYVLLFSSVPWV